MRKTADCETGPVRETTAHTSEVERAAREPAGTGMALDVSAWSSRSSPDVGAVLATGPAVVVACVLVLAVAAGAVGWLAGERHREALRREIGDRSSELRRALSELEIAQAETVRRLSMAVEFRDEDTGAHIERIGRFSTLLAEQIGMRSRSSVSGWCTPRRCTTSARWRSPTRSCSSRAS